MTAKSGKSRRAKGGAGEREFFKALSALLGETVTRDLSQTRDGGADGRIGPWRIEIKRQEKARIGPWWEQACAQAAPPAYPALAYRASRQPWRVIVALTSLAPAAAHFAHGREHGVPWTAEISLEAFAAIIRESLCAPEIGVFSCDPTPETDSAEKPPEPASGAAETAGAAGRDKIKRQKARRAADADRVEKVLQAYGESGLEARQIALITDLPVIGVARLLIALRGAGRAESRLVGDGRLLRWWAAVAAPADPAKKWARDVPLTDFDQEHQRWTRETLAPKVRWNPCGGGQ